MHALDIPPLLPAFEQAGAAGDEGASRSMGFIPFPAVAAEDIAPAIDSAEAARREAAEAEAVRLRTVSTELTAEVEAKMQAEDFCVNEGQWVVKKVLENLRRTGGWAVPKVCVYVCVSVRVCVCVCARVSV